MFYKCVFLVAVVFSSLTHAEDLQITMQERLRIYTPAFESVFRRAQLNPIFHYYPSLRSFKNVEMSRFDVEIARTEGAIEKIRDQVILIGPIGCAEIRAFVKKGSKLKIDQIRDLKNLRVGVVGGVLMGEILLKKENINYELISAGSSAYRMLEHNRLDVVLDGIEGLVTMREQKMTASIDGSGPIVLAVPAYIILQKRLSTLGPRLRAAFKEEMDTGHWVASFQKVNLSQNLPINTGLSCLKENRKK